jgi:5-methylcytosine-specific restriction endonuclease McrA
MVKSPKFEFLEDRKFFESLFEDIGPIESWLHLLDFSDHDKKQINFNKERNQVFLRLKAQYRSVCHLAYPNICTGRSEAIDHMIPLATNILNKKRGIKAKSGKKVPTQSIGANHLHNFALACNKCNGHKKHRFLDPSHLARVIKITRGNKL